jgi:NhaP-type Na+/H+ or K+/H+ antiporter
MHSLAFVVVALGILGFGLISQRVQTSVLTPPIVFVALGLAVSGILDLELGEGLVHTLAELTLVLVLFTDASRINLRLLRREHNLPVRLLALGMPLTVVLGTLAAIWLFPGFTAWEAALLAAVLAPTDAALGQAVVSSPRVPVRIRQTLNVESGLNDGIALPLVLIVMSMCASSVPGEGGASYWLRFAALQVTLGPLTGAVVGWVGGRLVEWGTKNRWMSDTFRHLSSLGLALLAYAGAELVGGNGFIAAFVAGLTVGNTVIGLGEALVEFAEAEGQLLTLLVFLTFGATMVPDVFAHLSWQAVVYGVLSLTVLRMLPVAMSLMGSGLSRPTVLFLGWFGPRGIASILFGLLVVAERSVLIHNEEIFLVVVVTVLLSVVAHGVTAYPGSLWYSRHAEGLHESAAERRDVAEMPVRIRHAG